MGVRRYRCYLTALLRRYTPYVPYLVLTLEIEPIAPHIGPGTIRMQPFYEELLWWAEMWISTVGTASALSSSEVMTLRPLGG